MVCNILEEQNFKVRTAANYDQAVLEINKRLPDLAILDIKLDKPDKDGIDLLKLIIKNKNVSNCDFRHATVQLLSKQLDLELTNSLKNHFQKKKS